MSTQEQMLDASNAADKALPVAEAAEAIQKAQKAIENAEIATLQARLDEAELNTKEATRLAKAATDNSAKLREQLAELTADKPDQAPRGKQADLLACNQQYMTEEKKRRKKLGTVETKVKKALKTVFETGAGRSTRRRVQKALRIPVSA